jgi:glycosyltransferase involved in cell wall biosynthesis
VTATGKDLSLGITSLSASVIIPTMNRPRDLVRCLDSIIAQTRRPKEVVVVDDGESDAGALAAQFEGTGILFVYVKKDVRGICRSRNQGILRSSGDVLVFLDDDTELDPGYIAAYLEVFERDPSGKIGGLGGRPTRFRNGVLLPEDHAVNWEERLRRFFLLSSAHGGRVLPSGFRTSMVDPHGIVPVEFLQGGNMALRRQVFNEFSFDETLDRLSGYAPGEDVMFSYPVSKRFSLFSIDTARMKHFHTVGGRPNRFLLARTRVIHQHRFLHELVNGTLLNRLAFGWAMVGLVVTHALGAALLGIRGKPVGPQIAALHGVLSGIAHVITQPTPRPSTAHTGLPLGGGTA